MAGNVAGNPSPVKDPAALSYDTVTYRATSPKLCQIECAGPKPLEQPERDERGSWPRYERSKDATRNWKDRAQIRIEHSFHKAKRVNTKGLSWRTKPTAKANKTTHWQEKHGSEDVKCDICDEMLPAAELVDTLRQPTL